MPSSFSGLETAYKQKKYFKQEFNLVVSANCKCMMGDKNFDANTVNVNILCLEIYIIITILTVMLKTMHGSWIQSLKFNFNNFFFYLIKEPISVELGTRRIWKKTRHKHCIVTATDSFYYIPLLESLKVYMQNICQSHVVNLASWLNFWLLLRKK